jgi:hypothetical protein
VIKADFDVVCILVKQSEFLEHDGVRLQEWNPVPAAVAKVGDVCVTVDPRMYFIYLGVPKMDDFPADRKSLHLEWCRQAEIALKKHFRVTGDTDEPHQIAGPDGIARHEFGRLEID